MKYNEELDYLQIRKNVMGNGASILKAIINWYMDGSFDHPKKALTFPSILATICEGKVKAESDESGNVTFKLTKEYEDHMKMWNTLLSDLEKENVVKGPWI